MSYKIEEKIKLLQEELDKARAEEKLKLEAKQKEEALEKEELDKAIAEAKIEEEEADKEALRLRKIEPRKELRIVGPYSWDTEERIKKMIQYNKFEQNLSNPLISEVSDIDFADIAQSCMWYINHFETKFKIAIDRFSIQYKILNGREIFVKERLDGVNSVDHPIISMLYNEKDIGMTYGDLKLKTLQVVRKMVEETIEDIRKFEWDKEIEHYISSWLNNIKK